MNGFQFGSHLGASHFGSSLMVALVKGPIFTFFICFQTFVFSFTVLGLGLGVRLWVWYVYTKSSALYYTLIMCYCHNTGNR